MATAVLEPPTSIVPPKDTDKSYGGDDNLFLHCLKCEQLILAKKSFLDLFIRRQGMCRKCFHEHIVISWGLNPRDYPYKDED